MGDSAAQKVRMIGEAIVKKGEEIYAAGGLSPDIWEEIVNEELLGKVAPNAAIARAIVAQLRNLEDEILRDIVIEDIIGQECKDRSMKKEPIKKWVQLLQRELNSKEPGSVLRGVEETKRENEEENRSLTNVEARAKVEFKLETYEGQEDKCAVWFHGLERQMMKLRINRNNYVAHDINSTVGKARTMIAMLDERFEGRYDEIR